MKIAVYSNADKNNWDEFVSKSKNGVFIFYRDYIEYHKDRFEDFSLIIKNQQDQIIGLFPANKESDTLVSHRGLSFGGCIVDNSMKTNVMLELFETLLNYTKEAGFKKLIYKTVPFIYHQHPAEEDRYSLYISKANLTSRSVFTVIDPKNRLPMQERRIRGIKKAQAANTVIKQSNKLEEYWDLLESLLAKQHNSSPVHTLSEITRLITLFPSHIKLYAAFKEEKMLAGVLVYENKSVARAQYIASDESGKKSGALDLLFHHLITETYHHKKYFDFSSSDSQQGSQLNLGLIEQKEGFGGRSVAVDQYAIDLANWHQGDCLKVIS